MDFKFPDYPRALVGIYKMPKVNQAIQLYRGHVQIRDEHHSLEGEGRIYAEWLPRPAIKIEASLRFDIGIGGLGRVSVLVPSLNLSAKGLVTHIENFSRVTALVQEAVLGHGPLEELSFHLVNFTDYVGVPISEGAKRSWAGRCVLASDSWSLTLDEVINGTRVFEELAEQGGYAITHIGRARKADGTSFSVEAAEECINLIHHFAAFARGRWCSAALPFAKSEHGVLWQKWNTGRPDHWTGYGLSWLPSHVFRADALRSSWSGFVRLWESGWCKTLQAVVAWYVESQSIVVESAIVLVQAALERLSFQVATERKLLSGEAFGKLTAAEQIHFLLELNGIPSSIPDEARAISAVCRRFKRSDGPTVFTGVRNHIIHPPKNKRKLNELSFEDKLEVLFLGQVYLELTLLRLLGYSGRYWNRLKRIEEAVPWE